MAQVLVQFCLFFFPGGHALFPLLLVYELRVQVELLASEHGLTKNKQKTRGLRGLGCSRYVEGATNMTETVAALGALSRHPTAGMSTHPLLLIFQGTSTHPFNLSLAITHQ